MLEGYEELTSPEQEMVQQLIQTLLAQTFLLERKYDKKTGRMAANRAYDFCDRNFALFKEYFAIAGMELGQDTELGTIYLRRWEGHGERLTKLGTIYLLLLKLIYDEKMAAASTSVSVTATVGELSQKAGEFRLLRGLSGVTEIRRAFQLLRKYQLIELFDTLEEINENTKIIIYPSINLVLLREDIAALLSSFEEAEETTEAEEENGLEDEETEDKAAEWNETEREREGAAQNGTTAAGV